jgi:hypothetical protein
MDWESAVLGHALKRFLGFVTVIFVSSISPLFFCFCVFINLQRDGGIGPNRLDLTCQGLVRFSAAAPRGPIAFAIAPQSGESKGESGWRRGRD